MAARLTGPDTNEPQGDWTWENGNDLVKYGWAVADSWPAVPDPQAPPYLPESVRKSFLAAERNFLQNGMEEAAAGSYGRALDVATKLIAAQEPDAERYEKQQLFNRLNMLSKSKRITPDLAEWAHHIRSIRNDALHSVENLDREELAAIRGFTEMVLRYLFTLPGMLAERKAAAAAGLTEPAPTEREVAIVSE